MEFILNILYESYQWPAGVLYYLTGNFKYIGQSETLYQLCVSFSVPAIIIAMVLADLALGLLNRSAQQLNVFFLLNAAQKVHISSTLTLIPYALHHYLVESDKFYIYLKDWFPICMSENRTAYRERST